MLTPRGGVLGQHIRIPLEKSLSVSRPSRNQRSLHPKCLRSCQAEFAGGSKPASFQTERFSEAAINFTKADAALGAVLSVVIAAAP